MRQPRLLLSALVLVLSSQLAAQRRLPMGAAALREASISIKGVDADHIRGAVLVCRAQRHGVLHEAVGFRHHAYGVPMLKDSLFRMASNTKRGRHGHMMLAEEGKLAVADPVANTFRRSPTTIARHHHRTAAVASSGLRIEPIFYPLRPVRRRRCSPRSRSSAPKVPRHRPATIRTTTRATTRLAQ